MKISDHLRQNERILMEQTDPDDLYLTNFRVIFHNNEKPDYIRLYQDKIPQYGEIIDDYAFLELTYLRLIILDDYRYGSVAYIYFSKNLTEKPKKARNKKRKIKTDIEIGLGFQNQRIFNLFLKSMIELIPEIVICGFPAI